MTALVKIVEFRGAYRFLSNFYLCDVAGWRSVEHTFQAAKTTDPNWRMRIRNACDACIPVHKQNRLGALLMSLTDSLKDPHPK